MAKHLELREGDRLELKLLPVQRQSIEEMKAWARDRTVPMEPLIIDETDLKVALVTNRLELAALNHVIDATPGASPRPVPRPSALNELRELRGLDIHRLFEAWLQQFPEARVHVEHGRMSLDELLRRRTPEQKHADFGFPGGLGKYPADPPKEQPRAFKKGSFFPPESVAKGRRFNKPQRKFR